MMSNGREHRQEHADSKARFQEILEVLRRHNMPQEMTPENLCAVLEELGPTFIKLGQILSMRCDMLPLEYCEALSNLRSHVPPMPFEQVKSIVEQAYAEPLEDVFTVFDQQALGSASIAQVHRATTRTGDQVVVKVQREGIHDTMSRDISLLKKAVRFLKYTPAKGLVDMNRVLDEMWLTAQQEMNFQTEARNLALFHQLNADVPFVGAPKLYPEYTAQQVLVMEYVEGIPIDDLAALREAQYDPSEIAYKLADNYVKQITEDGFFHADPHPGNLLIRDGKIIFLDMGMMGTLSSRDQSALTKCVEAVAHTDVNLFLDAVTALGAAPETLNREKLLKDCQGLMQKYGDTDWGDMDMTALLRDVMDLMRAYGIRMPSGLTMLVRGMATIEGVVTALCPDVHITRIASKRIGTSFLRGFDWKNALLRDSKALYESRYKALGIPALIYDTLTNASNGALDVRHHIHRDARQFIDQEARRMTAGFLAGICVIGAGLFQTHAEMTWLGLSPASWALLAVAGLLAGCAFRKREK